MQAALGCETLNPFEEFSFRSRATQTFVPHFTCVERPLEAIKSPYDNISWLLSIAIVFLCHSMFLSCTYVRMEDKHIRILRVKRTELWHRRLPCSVFRSFVIPCMLCISRGSNFAACHHNYCSTDPAFRHFAHWLWWFANVLFLFPWPPFSWETLHPVLYAYLWASSGEPEECLLGNSNCK